MNVNLPEEVISLCEKEVGPVMGYQPASGGCINNGGTVLFESGRVFIKYNDAAKFPDMFAKEAQGLQLLQKANTIRIPSVIAHYVGKHYTILILEAIQSGPPKPDFWKSLAEGLAGIHRQQQSTFGLDHDNYMGSLKQSNQAHSNGIEFFINCRLQPQLDLASRSGKIGVNELKKFDHFFNKLSEYLIMDTASLIHGDLWSGNFMIDAQGDPVLIDPAVAYFHREADLAMTQLFGGFDSSFYRYYQEIYPLERGYNDRFDIYNLYPLLIHVNLFGGGYLNQTMHLLNRFL